MKSHSLKIINKIDSPALTHIIEYWKEYDKTTIIFALFEIKEREYPYLPKLNENLLNFYKENGFSDENNLIESFLKENNSTSYKELCKKNDIEVNLSNKLVYTESSGGNRKYPFLKIISVMYIIFGILMIISTIFYLFNLELFFMTLGLNSNTYPTVFQVIVVLLYGFLTTTILFSISEAARALIAIEFNTRGKRQNK
jgi:hypothetical protein